MSWVRARSRDAHGLCRCSRLAEPGELIGELEPRRWRGRRYRRRRIRWKNRAAPWESLLRHEETRRGLPRFMLPVGDRQRSVRKADLGEACEGERHREDETDSDEEAEAPKDTEVEVQIHELVGRSEGAIRFEKGHHRLRPIVDFELPIDRCQMELHRMHRDAQASGDLSICHALCHQLHYLRFSDR